MKKYWKDGARIILLPFMAVGMIVGCIVAPFYLGFRTGVRIVDEFIDDNLIG